MTNPMVPQPPLNQQDWPLGESLCDLVQSNENGHLSCTDLVRKCLSRIDQIEPQVHAWVMVDGAGALELAEAADARRAENRPMSLLDGIPVGVKDIIDVAGWPTMAGFKPWREKVATADAWIVSKMRQAGMIPLGKTVTTQFASIDPPPTLNPWNLGHTPGGSSSGSCVAVACGMVPLALGSQTGGSINRPASFCGVSGLKLALGQWPTQGVVPSSQRLDTLGPIVRRVKDLTLVMATLPGLLDKLVGIDLFEKGLRHDTGRALKILKLGGRFQALASLEMQAAVELAAERFREAGCVVEYDENAAFFDDDLWQIHRTIMMADCFANHETEFAQNSVHYAPKIRGWVETGREIPEPVYFEAQRASGAKMEEFTRKFGPYDAVLIPAAVGEAPSPETTGDPVFNAPWTLLGVPSLTVPVRLSSSGLPLGIQIVATRFGGAAFGRLLNAGMRIDGQ